jgi:NAD+ synthase
VAPDPALTWRAPAEPDLRLDPEWSVRLLTDFIRKEVTRTGRARVVLGLSGGMDSALAAHLAARALGSASVHGVLMPYRASDAASVRDARTVVAQLGIPAEEIDTTPLVDAFESVSGRVDRRRLGNAMSRCRMLLLYDRSAQHGALVLGTSNKTELLLGYGTLHGDLASAINPLGDLYKTQVRQLAAHVGVPEPILSKPPSADLWPQQSDEEELGYRYDQLDRLLALLVDARVSRSAAVAAGFAESMVDRVIRMVVDSQYKRRLPVIAKMSTRSVGWDFRYPRDWRT